jgi:signal transduction histidine kinase
MKLALADDTWDIVLIDHVMPEFSGPAALTLLEDAGLDIPPIIVSGVIGEEAAVNAMRAGARDYILKDRLNRLVPAIDRELGELRRRKDHKSMQEQLFQSQKMETVGRLAGGIAHDFNNMLTAILGYTYSGIRDLPEEDHRRLYFEEIQKAAERASNLTQQLLAFSRRQIIEPKVVNLNRLVVDTSTMIRSVVGEGVELVTLLDPNLYNVKVDSGQMARVLINLATNARDAMPNGGKFTVETTNVTVGKKGTSSGSRLSPGDYTLLAVSDNGVGIPPDVQEHLFEPFFTTKEVGKGTGLGLATCFGIVEQNGGHIEAESDLNRGTTFRIHLPRAMEEVPGVPVPEESIDLHRGTETILIVEDEPLVRNMVVRILFEQGYKVLEAANGEEALRVVASHAGENIHLLLTDLVMPQMGGKDLAERLKSLRPNTKVLLTSGYCNDLIFQNGELGDKVSFIQKPFMPADLVSKVQEVLSA